MTDPQPPADYDLLVIGGGINGAGIARDAAGRGGSVGGEGAAGAGRRAGRQGR